MVFPFFIAMWAAFMIGGLVALVFAILSIVEVAQAPEPAFGPPWDNGKNAWLLGLALAFVVPFGVVVAPIVWWTQGRPALRRGQQVPRPFWAPGRPQYPPYPPPPPGDGTRT